MDVIVTGCAGFLGSSIARQLIANGHAVTGMDSMHLDDAWRLKGAPLKSYLWKGIQDLHESEVQDYVIHCAGSADVAHTRNSPRLAVDQSIYGTAALMEACRRRGVKRVVLISSYSAYGRSPYQPIPEDVPLRPTSLYGAVKAAQESIALAYANDGVPVVAIRSSTLYGPRGRATLPVTLFLGKAMRGEPITLTGDGSQTRDQNYVGNAVTAIIAALTADGVVGQAINVGSGREVTMLELAQLCIKVEMGLGGLLNRTPSRIEFLPPREGEEGRLVLDIEKAKRLLGYEAKVSLGDGIKMTAEWMRKSGR